MRRKRTANGIYCLNQCTSSLCNRKLFASRLCRSRPLARTSSRPPRRTTSMTKIKMIKTTTTKKATTRAMTSNPHTSQVLAISASTSTLKMKKMNSRPKERKNRGESWVNKLMMTKKKHRRRKKQLQKKITKP